MTKKLVSVNIGTQQGYSKEVLIFIRLRLVVGQITFISNKYIY